MEPEGWLLDISSNSADNDIAPGNMLRRRISSHTFESTKWDEQMALVSLKDFKFKEYSAEIDLSE